MEQLHIVIHGIPLPSKIVHRQPCIGDYDFIITDANGCVVTNSFNINDNNTLPFTNVSLFDDSILIGSNYLHLQEQSLMSILVVMAATVLLIQLYYRTKYIFI